MLYELCGQTFCYAFSQNSGLSGGVSLKKRDKVGFVRDSCALICRSGVFLFSSHHGRERVSFRTATKAHSHANKVIKWNLERVMARL